jgi:hypothetical protein
MPDQMKCEAATCRSGKPAVVFIDGYHDNPVTKVREVIRLHICAECAGPLLKVGQPISVGSSCLAP